MAKPKNIESLNPEALKFYRREAHLTQRTLAELTRHLVENSKDNKVSISITTISITTISRWETGKQVMNIRPGKRKALELALGVSWEKLTRPPEEDNISSFMKRLPLKAGIAGASQTALRVMQIRYGVTEESINDLGPLAVLILAERSLQSRQAGLDEALQGMKDAQTNALTRASYMRGAFYDVYDHERIDAEKESLKNRRIFEEYEDEDDEGEMMSPFVDFLRKELDEFGLFREYPIDFQSYFWRAPEFEIPVEIISPFIDLDASSEADQRALKLIQEGHIDLLQVWKKKEEATNEEFRNWLADECQTVEENLPETLLGRLTRSLREQSAADGANREDSV